ncbi:ATP-dependent DNA helicase RecG [Peptococcus simiae]|uniref:ATP-dependent DNA helicase RecG n=1 Tax=Peptococcus simiae TaxID=1643805 RepID=UPI00397EB1E9
MTWLLTDPVTVLKGVGSKRASQFGILGIRTLFDLVQHYPFRYDDYTEVKPVGTWIDGETVAYAGRVVSVENARTRTGKSLVKALLEGPQGEVVATWFGRWQLDRQLSHGRPLFCVGRVNARFSREIVVTRHAFLKDLAEADQYRRIEPVYATTEGLSGKLIQDAVSQVLAGLPLMKDIWPQGTSLCPIPKAWQLVHQPPNREALDEALKALKTLEFMLLILWARERGGDRQRGIAHPVADDLTRGYLAALPYDLTVDQKKAVEAIWADMASPYQMHRLLQGDVGSGKTTVAILALLRAVAGGHQGALMAPTEILATQHELTMKEDLARYDIRVETLTGSLSPKVRQERLADLAAGDIDLVIGTHALFEPDVVFKDLSCVVIDEQHRFGVRQRQLLTEKGLHPDLLVMTATPIPRSLALTVYGDLDLTLIRSMPPGRQPIKTYVMGSHKRENLYGFLRTHMAAGERVYMVCPLVEESEKLDLQNAESLYSQLAGTVFPDFSIGLLHGRMKAADKAAVMADFAAGQLQMVVSTTVIEVGVNVPEATIMVIENADRFGLAQLHQLRGRVGRGSSQSYCFLVSDNRSPEARARLELMSRTSDGFEIAEADLAQRGPGELLGLRQSGQGVFRLADPVRDQALVLAARDLAKAVQVRDEVPPLLTAYMNDMRRRMMS